MKEPKTTTSPGWTRVLKIEEPGGNVSWRWDGPNGLRAMSGTVRSLNLHHVSVTNAGEPPTDDQCEEVLAAFGMSSAREENPHTAKKARHFWL